MQPQCTLMGRASRRGFTLIELLLVIGIIGILAAVVILAINPTRQLGDAKDVSRRAAIREIGNAVSQYIIDGNTITGLPPNKASAIALCREHVTGADCTDAPVQGFDLSGLTPRYLVALPVDPDEEQEALTGYRMYRDGSFVIVCSPRLDEECGS